MAPADQFSLSDRGVLFKSCDTCRAANRTYMTQYGDPQCEHGKRRARCLVCNPASAFGGITANRAQQALGSKLPVSRRWDHVCVSWSGTGSIIIRSGERIRRYAVKNPRGERATALTPAASIVGSMASTSSTVIHGNIAAY